MKDGTENKLKFLDLMARSQMPRWQVRGLLDSLWKFTADNCPQGDIGRYTDEQIALGIDWRDDPARLVKMLIETRWIDAHDQFRLIVHHWSEHCEDKVHRTLARAKLRFVDGSAPKLTRLERHEREEAERFYVDDARRASAGARRASAGARKTPAGAEKRRPDADVHPSPARPGPAKPSLAIARPGPVRAQPEPAPAPSQRAREPELETDPPRGANSGVTGACADGQAGGATAPVAKPAQPGRSPPAEHAARANGTAPTPAQGRLLARVDAGLLRDTPRLVAWIAEASGVDPPLVSASEADRLRVVGAAERALETGTDPPKLFVATVRSRAWERITQAQEDRARRRLVEYDRQLRATDTQRHALRSKLESIGRAEPKSVQEAR